jgi:hypothetical protein
MHILPQNTPKNICVTRDTFPDPVIALPHMSLPVNAKGMQAAWNIHG